MNNEYLIVLFKNKQRYKIIKKFKTYSRALSFYESETKKSNNVVFEIKTENGKLVEYELGLLEFSDKKNKLFSIDDIGRNVSSFLEDSNYSLINIIEYKIPEKIFCLKTKNRITTDELLSKYISKGSFKLVSKLNNKIIIQNDDEFTLFSTKSEYDAERLINSLEKYSITNNISSSMFVKDTSIEQKKYLYDLLSNKGINKKMLYRKSTTHLKDK